MNVRIEAGPCLVSVEAELRSPVISTQLNIVSSNSHDSLIWACLSPALSINGHSLNAINPNSVGGELTTSALA
jgi:hypothetical protein